MTRKRIDNNQKQVTNELRSLGFSVTLTHEIGKGFPDMVVGFGGVNYMVELKNNDKAKLTNDEQEFAWLWNGQVNHHSTTEQIIVGFFNHCDSVDFDIIKRRLRMKF